MTDDIKKIVRRNDLLFKSVNTIQQQTQHDHDEFRREIDDFRRRLDRLEKSVPTAPGDAIKKGANEYDDWPRRIAPEDVRRPFIFDAPERLQ